MKKNIDLLKLCNGKNISINYDKIQLIKEEMFDFIDNCNDNYDKHYIKKVLLESEVKSNNEVEGYYDDILDIRKVTYKGCHETDNNKRNRILNLYNGYKFIIKHNEINKNTLNELYSILSKDLLCKYDIEHMGKYYREDPVDIYMNYRYGKEPDHGIDYQDIEEYMNYLFSFINNNQFQSDQIDIFIKSQIIHFYFVYIHPYFDLNGRTSRTVAMWHLYNHESYPYMLFNRAIHNVNSYYHIIQNSKRNGDLSTFINYMLVNLKEELEKEHLVRSINDKLNSIDYQTLHLYLQMNEREKTLLDFAATYNNHNKKRSVKEIYKYMIEPLIEKNIFTIERYTNKKLYDGNQNMVLKLNENKVDNNPKLIKRLKI